MNFKCDVFCPPEDWRVEALVCVLPRDGDQLRHKDKLYKVVGAEHTLVANGSGVLQEGYLVRKPLVYVSPLK